MNAGQLRAIVAELVAMGVKDEDEVVTLTDPMPGSNQKVTLVFKDEIRVLLGRVVFDSYKAKHPAAGIAAPSPQPKVMT